MKSQRYPGANLNLFFGGKYPGKDQPDLDKIVLHSTETSAKWGCPGYAGGASAPTFTINPWPGYEKIWQHFDVNQSARALVNPDWTLVSENQDEVCQIEIIGYSDAKIAADYGFDLRDLPDSGYTLLAKLMKFVMEEWSVPNNFATPWLPYPSSYGNSRARMTSSQYDKFQGICGHQHVSGNVHGDPTIDVAKLQKALGKPAIPPRTISMRVAEDGYWGPATIKAFEKKFIKVPVKGTWTIWDVRALQRKLGVKATGSLDITTIRTLQRTVGAKADGIWPRDKKSETTLKIQQHLNRL